MRKFASIAGAVALAMVTAVVALAAFSGGSSAGPGDGTGAGIRQPLVPASLVAIAIGQVVEQGGETATIDLHASIRDGRAVGNFRFYSEEYGYYNGGVRTLKVQDGVITATGGGGLFPPDGGRVQVRYTAVISTQDNHVVVTVKGKNVQYTIEGTLEDGFTFAGDPKTQLPPAN